jgi:hypothetical protein
VNFALAGLGTSKNAKYDTAVQLYNLERDSGKAYSLEDIEKKFFVLDKKFSREAAKTRVAQGNVAMGHRGERNTYRSRNSRHPRRNGHKKTADANASTDSNTANRHANITCYNCGKKGHIMPNCPEKKSGKVKNKPAQGNAARTTSDPDATTSELVCLARHVELPTIRTPRLRRPAPSVTVDVHARHLGDTDIFVTLAIRVDESTFSWERERSLKQGHLEELYAGDLEPLDEPLWVLLHNRPFDDLDTRVARITRPDHRARGVFLDGILPALQRGFGLEPNTFPKCYWYWHSLVQAYLEYRLENIEQGLTLPVTIGTRHRTVTITFYPIRHLTPVAVSIRDAEYITHPDDSDEDWEPEHAFMAINQTETVHAMRTQDPSIYEIGDPADLKNYLPDSRATQHMTPRLADLVDVVEGQNFRREGGQWPRD